MSETSTVKNEWGDQVRASLREEIEHGGDLSPCPFCKVPRVQRSDYVRCCGCGINWSPGENLDKDPKIERYQKMVEAQRKTAKATP